MPITYTAGTAEQRTFTILPAGDYRFRVLDATEKQSKNGNDMIELKLDVYADNGPQAVVYDNIVFTATAQWKCDQFLKSCGMLPAEGEIVNIVANEWIGFEGRVKIKVKKDSNNNDRNEVVAYLWDDEAF